MSDFYVILVTGSLLSRAEVILRVSPDHHSLVCTCYEVADAERIAAALNSMEQLVDALRDAKKFILSPPKNNKGWNSALNRIEAALDAVGVES